MKNLNSIKPQAHLSKNPFDRSRRDVYSLKPAMLVPTFVEDTIPDSRYEISDLSIIRTQPIQSAPFARMTRHTEYYYVPYSQLYRDFEKIYYERGENQRNVANTSSVSQATHVPYFHLQTLVLSLASEYLMLRIMNDVRAAAAARSNSALVIVQTLMDNFTQQQNDLVVGPLSDIHGRWCVEDSFRLLDLLGYGNYLPIMKLATENAVLSLDSEDPYTEYDSQISAVLSAILDEPSTQGSAVILLNAMFNDMNPAFLEVLQDTLDGINRYVSVFRLAAYLKVWSDMYRNSQYDVNVNYAYYFNFDYAVTNDLAIVPLNKMRELVIPRYRQWKKDLFTGTFPTAQFGETAVAELNNPVTIINSTASTITDGSSVSVTRSSSASYAKGQLLLRNAQDSIISGSGNWNINSSVSAVAMRQALAFQRYRESLLRAGNRLTALQRAMFGDSSRYIENNYVDFLGAWSSQIDFNTVAATAESDGQNVGQLSSNGVSTSSNNHIRFHSHDFGMIIAMTYILPESEYDAYGLDPQLRKSESFDFYKSHFQNLGLSEIFNFDFNIVGSNADQYVDSVIGYLPRYWEYKCAYDKVHGEFYGSLPVSPNYLLDQTHISADLRFASLGKGAFSQFVTPRLTIGSAMTLSRFYVSPSCVDNIFYDATNEFQATDKFLVSEYHEVKCLLPMSVLGLPQ